MSPEQYVQEKAAKSGSSFYYAFLFLPPVRRAAITAFYAFCREVDDVVDETQEPAVAAQKLAWWRSEVQRSYAGTPSHPVMKALMPHAASFDIGVQHLLAIIDGCEMDLTQTRYLDWPALELYCHRVAGIVGEVAARIFGQVDPATTTYAHTLGQAMQLTNILRDVGEDARRGRIYIPQVALQAHGLRTHDLLRTEKPYAYGPAFTALMKALADRAHMLYDRALGLLPAVDRRTQRPGLMMAAIYRTLLREIEADGFQVLHQRTSLTPVRKLWIAWRTNWAQR